MVSGDSTSVLHVVSSMRESPRLSALLSVCCCLLTTTRATATAAAENSRAPLPSPFGALPFWRRHYLLANDSVQLEPCSAARAPRAWLASRPTAHGSLQLPGASGGPGASTTQGSGPGAQLPGTAVVQALIYAHQHPADCSKARFLVYQHPGHLGLGALLDYLSDALAWAWAEERVLLIDYPSSWTRCWMAPAALHQRLSWVKGQDLAAPTGGVILLCVCVPAGVR